MCDSHKTSFKVVYSVSDDSDLVTQTLDSIKTVRKFVSKDDIIIFYTPPRSKRNYEKLSKIATVKNVPNITKLFIFDKKRGPRRYGEKVHLCEVDFPNVVFLDGDTMVKKDLSPLLGGDFDFSARFGRRSNREFDKNVWEQMFEVIGKQPIPMYNSGFMVFQNYCHKKIGKYWLRYINEKNLPNPHPALNFKEQYSLALALAIVDAKIKPMTAKQHAFVWDGEKDTDTYVVHGRPATFYTKLRSWLREYARILLRKNALARKIYCLLRKWFSQFLK